MSRLVISERCLSEESVEKISRNNVAIPVPVDKGSEDLIMELPRVVGLKISFSSKIRIREGATIQFSDCSTSKFD